MDNEQRRSKNEQIAAILGITKHGVSENGVKDSFFIWDYPPEFEYLKAEVPQTMVPDFIELLEKLNKIKKIARGY